MTSTTNYGVIFSTTKITTHEAGETTAQAGTIPANMFGVKLSTAPRHDVVITLNIDDATEAVFKSNNKTTGTLTFTPDNWNIWQGVAVQGVDDDPIDSDITYNISSSVKSDDLNYDGMRSGTGVAVANIIGTNLDNDQGHEYFGDRSNDYLVGSNGADDMYGDYGRDELHGGNADDRVYGGYGDDVLFGDAGDDQLEGEQGDDKLNGGDGDDTLIGGTGNDKLAGGNGNDSLDGSVGKDIMDGGNGADTYYVDNALDVVSDSGTDVGVVDTVNIAAYVSSTFKYTLGVGIENAVLNEEAKDADLSGNLSDNNLSGNSFDNQMDGGAGTDNLNGGAGNDNLAGGLGNDKLLGGVGTDTLNGGDGIDNLDGGLGNDKLLGGLGTDTLNGGDGTDNLDGGLGNDKLLGGLGTDTLNGGEGTDNLDGGTGNDLLCGGNGTDKLTGGAGIDRFDFNASIEIGKGSVRDSITDFSHSQGDRIDFAGIDANTKVGGDQGFIYIGAKAFTGVAGQLDYFNGILSADTNGDKVADFELSIVLVGGTSSLVNADFVL